MKKLTYALLFFFTFLTQATVTLLKQAGWFTDIQISVLDGMVLIAGKAKDKDQLTWLAKTADRLPAVVAVIDKVE